jgi:hypothetical protein
MNVIPECFNPVELHSGERKLFGCPRDYGPDQDLQEKFPLDCFGEFDSS